MNDKKSILIYQMAVLLICSTMGSAIVYIPNPISYVAGNAAWISLAFAYAFGMLVLACVLFLHRAYDGRGLLEMSRLLFGKTAAVLIAVLFILMLLFAIPAIVVGINSFFTTIMMKETPSFVFSFLTFFTVAFTVGKGLQVIARMFVLLLVMLIAVTLVILILAIPLYKVKYALPVMPNGVMPVLIGLFTSGGFPYGEIVFFTILLPFSSRHEEGSLSKNMYLSLSVTGIMLVLSSLCTLMVFGPATGIYKFSLYILASEIRVADIIERIESIIGIVLIIGSYMKATIYLFMLNQLFVQLLKLKNDRLLLTPLTGVCVLLSLTMFKGDSDFSQQVYVIWPLFVLTVGCLIVFTMTLLTFLRKGIKNDEDDNGRDPRIESDVQASGG